MANQFIEDRIAEFRNQLHNNGKTIVVFVHSPKDIGSLSGVPARVVFERNGKIIPFVEVEQQEFNKDNNYSLTSGFTPLAFSLLASILKRNGFESTILELSHSKNPCRIILGLKNVLELSGYSIIWAFTATSPSNYCAMRLASLVNSPGSLTFFGGSHATAVHSYAIHSCPQIDFIFAGEAEDSLLQLMNFIIHCEGLIEKIPGLTYRTIDGVHFGNNVRQPGGKLSFPDFEFLSVDQFPEIFGNERVFRIQSARGCQYRCSFCSQAIPLQVSELNSLNHYLIYLSEKSNSRKLNVFFEDATFTSNRKRTMDFCNQLTGLKKSFGVSIQFGCQTRADCLDSELISALASAGCFYVYLGVESFNSESLKLVHKGINYSGFSSPHERMEETIRLLNKHRIMIGCSVIAGLSSDSPNSFGSTISRLKQLGVHMIFIESIKVFPKPPLTIDIIQELDPAAIEIVSKYYSEIKSHSSNLEDKNCLLACDEKKLGDFYAKASEILEGDFTMISNGLYVNTLKYKSRNHFPLNLFCSYKLSGGSKTFLGYLK